MEKGDSIDWARRRYLGSLVPALLRVLLDTKERLKDTRDRLGLCASLPLINAPR